VYLFWIKDANMFIRCSYSDKSTYYKKICTRYNYAISSKSLIFQYKKDLSTSSTGLIIEIREKYKKMKFTITHNKILESVRTLAKIATKNTSLPILKNIKMEVLGATLTMNATNLDVGVTIRVPVKDAEDGVCVVDATVFLSYIGLLPQKTKISIEKVGEHVVISSERGVAKFTTVEAADFPEIPQISNAEANRVTMKTLDFVGGIRSVVFSCAFSAMRPELSSVYIYKNEDELVFVATDTFRLAEKRISMDSVDIEPVLIPSKVAQEIVKLFGESEGDISVCFEDGQVSIQNDDLTAIARTVSGVFPDYKQIIPTDSLTCAAVLKGDLQNALRASTIFSDKFNQVTLTVLPEKEIVVLDTKNVVSGENTYNIHSGIEGEEVSLNFNYSYFNDVMSTIKSDSINLLFNGKGKPVVIRDEDHKFLYLIMPMSKN